MERKTNLSDADQSAVRQVEATLAVVTELSGGGKFFPQFDSHDLCEFFAAQRDQLSAVLDSNKSNQTDERADTQQMIGLALQLVKEALEPGSMDAVVLENARRLLSGRAGGNKALMADLDATFWRVAALSNGAPAQAAQPKPKARKRSKLATMPAAEAA